VPIKGPAGELGLFCNAGNGDGIVSMERQLIKESLDQPGTGLFDRFLMCDSHEPGSFPLFCVTELVDL
jgi:hypothetical protein